MDQSDLLQKDNHYGTVSSVIDCILHIDRVITALVSTHSSSVYGITGLLLFLECGIVLLPFLPGDSLLFVVGALCAKHLVLMKGVLIAGILGATLGNMVNYIAGDGVRRYGRLNPFRLIKKEAIAKSEAFFRKYGTFSIIFSRFLPFCRTFVPFIAGFSQMPLRKYILTSTISAALWVSSMTYLGYITGDLPFIRENVTLLVGAVIMLSLIPIVLSVYRLQRHTTPNMSSSHTDQS